jgi:hypothetical protein
VNPARVSQSANWYKIGFHQPNFPGLRDAERQRIIAREEQRLRELGVTESFARRANATSPDDMWFPTSRELIAEGVVSRIVDPAEFAASGIDVKELTAIKVDEMLSKQEAYAAIKRADPQRFTTIATKFEDGLKRGKSVGEMRAEIAPLVSDFYDQILPYLSDDDLIAYTRAVIRAVVTLNQSQPNRCYLFLNGQDSDPKLSIQTDAKYDEVVTALRLMLARAVPDANGKAVRIPSEASVSVLKDKVWTSLKVRYGKDVDVLSEAPVPEIRYRVYCSVVSATYEEALKLPRKDSVALLRFLFSQK